MGQTPKDGSDLPQPKAGGGGKGVRFAMATEEDFELELTPSEFKAWLALKFHANKQTCKAWPTHQTIARVARVGTRTVKRMLTKVQKARKLAFVDQSKKGTVYQLVRPRGQASGQAGQVEVRGGPYPGGEVGQTELRGGTPLAYITESHEQQSLTKNRVSRTTESELTDTRRPPKFVFNSRAGPLPICSEGCVSDTVEQPRSLTNFGRWGYLAHRRAANPERC